jgi:PHF5-like protein
LCRSLTLHVGCLVQAKHHPDLIMCRKQPGIAIGRLCEKCDGKCVVCDSYVRPATLVRVCDECNYGSYAGRCVICGGIGISDAYYCKVPSWADDHYHVSVACLQRCSMLWSAHCCC